MCRERGRKGHEWIELKEERGRIALETTKPRHPQQKGEEKEEKRLTQTPPVRDTTPADENTFFDFGSLFAHPS